MEARMDVNVPRIWLASWLSARCVARIEGDGIKFAHSAVEVKVVKLDDKPRLPVVLMRIVGGAAKFKAENRNRTQATASQSPPRRCMAIMGSAIACSGLIAQYVAEPKDGETIPLSMLSIPPTAARSWNATCDGCSGTSLVGIGGAPVFKPLSAYRDACRRFPTNLLIIRPGRVENKT